MLNLHVLVQICISVLTYCFERTISVNNWVEDALVLLIGITFSEVDHVLYYISPNIALISWDHSISIEYMEIPTPITQGTYISEIKQIR